MTFTPKPIHEVRRYLEEQGGTISIARFCEPSSPRGFRGYHLGKAQIMQGNPDNGCAPSGKDDYSIQTARDKAGLSEARAAIDIQFAPKKLQDYSKWLLGQGQANAPGTSDWREVIYSPDGAKVLRWDRERGVTSAPREGEADNTHLYHTHVSFYRDSENRAKVGAFNGYFATTPPPGGDVTPEQVMELQEQLNSAGANPQLVVDGVYGPKTEAAVTQITTQLPAAKQMAVAASATVVAAKSKAAEIVKL